MSTFGGLIFTNVGRNLQAKVQAGAMLNFTRIAIGDGDLGGSSIVDLTALKHQVKSCNITKLKTMTGGKAVVGTAFSNSDIVSGFYWKELGVFAQDPDLGEILYCYGNAGANAEYIPAGGGPDIIEKSIDAVTIVGNAANVTATIDSSLTYVSTQDFDSHTGNNVIHVTQVDRDTWGAKETPAGAQAKADAAQTAAEAYSDAALNAHLADYVKQPADGGTTGGTATAYTCSSNPAPTALVDKIGVVITVHIDSGANPTLNWNNFGAKPIKKPNGNAATLKAGGVYTLRYNATSGNFILQGEGASGNATASDLLSGKTASTDAGDITGTMPNNGAETKALTVYTLQNIIANGSFEDGSTGFTFAGTGGSIATDTVKYGVNSYKMAVSGTEAYLSRNLGLTANHKYYACANVYNASGLTSNSPRLYLRDGTTVVNNVVSNINITNAWQFISMIATPTTVASPNMLIGICYGTATGTAWADGITLIDLTATFGAGYEPTQAQMDAIMTALGGWFDGSAIISKMPIGAYITNGASGAPDVLIADPNLIPANILSGKTIFGVAGSAKRMATGTFALPGTTSSYTVSGLSFIPSIILIDYGTVPNSTAPTIDAAFQWTGYDGTTTGWIQSVGNWSTKTLPASKPTTNSFTVNQIYSSSYTMYARWWAFE